MPNYRITPWKKYQNDYLAKGKVEGSKWKTIIDEIRDRLLLTDAAKTAGDRD